VRTDLDRAFDFARWLQERTSTRIEPFRWGTALFNDDLPQRYYSNFVRVDQPLDAVGTGELLEETERAMLGLGHRQVQVFDEGDGSRIVPDLRHAGYGAEHSAMMALRREPDRAPVLGAVDECDFSEVRDFVVETYRRSLPTHETRLAGSFSDFRRVVQAAVGTRFFAQRVGGRIGGACELYLHDGLAQVEHVDTLAEYRGRGIARNVVLRAVHEAKGAGADLVIIEADLDDWPKDLYRRFGFDEVGQSWAFTRAPLGHDLPAQKDGEVPT
jgi:ribosomal protein S18 acetylase RimI-like enzyme